MNHDDTHTFGDAWIQKIFMSFLFIKKDFLRAYCIARNIEFQYHETSRIEILPGLADQDQKTESCLRTLILKRESAPVTE